MEKQFEILTKLNYQLKNKIVWNNKKEAQ
jgi:hypothetical protein